MNVNMVRERDRGFGFGTHELLELRVLELLPYAYNLASSPSNFFHTYYDVGIAGFPRVGERMSFRSSLFASLSAPSKGYCCDLKSSVSDSPWFRSVSKRSGRIRAVYHRLRPWQTMVERLSHAKWRCGGCKPQARSVRATHQRLRSGASAPNLVGTHGARESRLAERGSHRTRIPVIPWKLHRPNDSTYCGPMGYDTENATSRISESLIELRCPPPRAGAGRSSPSGGPRVA